MIYNGFTLKNHCQRPDIWHMQKGVIYRLHLAIVEIVVHVQTKITDQVTEFAPILLHLGGQTGIELVQKQYQKYSHVLTDRATS